MKRRRLFELGLAVVLGVVIWLFYRANARDPRQVTAVDRVVLRISAPLEHAFGALFGAWVKIWRQYLYLVDLKAENERLEEENATLAANNRYLVAHARRGRELGRFRAFMDGSAAELLPANVARHRIDTAQFRVVGIIIERRYEEIGCGAPVVTPEGVVGRVLYYELEGGEHIACPVTESLKSRRLRRRFGARQPLIGRAMVELTVDPQSRIDVRLPRTGARGILAGQGWDKGYAARIHYLGPKATVAPGDLVVTSGVDGRFPAGMPVGRVATVRRAHSQELEVVVRPALEFGKLDRVLVVISPPPPEAPAVRRHAVPRLGLVPYP